MPTVTARPGMPRRWMIWCVIERRRQRGKQVRRIRTRLKLTQKAAAEVFGGGVNAFSRYERGEVAPPRAVVKFLRVLDRHPELLDEVKRV